MEYTSVGIFGPVGIGRFRPPPFRRNSDRINGVGNRHPFSAIMSVGEGRMARRRLAMIPPWADGNRGQPRAAKRGPPFGRFGRRRMTSFSPLRARRRAAGFVEMAREIWDPPPKIVSGKECRRAPGSSGAVATDHDSNRAFRKSRIAHRQFKVPSFRSLIAAMGDPRFPFFRRPAAGPSASCKSSKKHRLD